MNCCVTCKEKTPSDPAVCSHRERFICGARACVQHMPNLVGCSVTSNPTQHCTSASCPSLAAGTRVRPGTYCCSFAATGFATQAAVINRVTHRREISGFTLTKSSRADGATSCRKTIRQMRNLTKNLIIKEVHFSTRAAERNASIRRNFSFK